MSPSIEFRAFNVRMACAACLAELLIPGPWDRKLMDRWHRDHIRPWVKGYTPGVVMGKKLQPTLFTPVLTVIRRDLGER